VRDKISNKTDNVLLIVAVVAVIVSIVGAGITYSYIGAFRNKMTGLATSGGWINLSVESAIALNFTYQSINWSNGSVTSGYDYALLDTTNQTSNNVSNGSWKGNHVGLVVENVGNKNVSLTMVSTNTNASIGGAAGSGPLMRWRFTNNDTATSCNFSANGLANNTWLDVNTTGYPVCSPFYFEDTRDSLRIDFFLRIPSDSNTGDIGSSIQATFNQM